VAERSGDTALSNSRPPLCARLSKRRRRSLTLPLPPHSTARLRLFTDAIRAEVRAPAGIPVEINAAMRRKLAAELTQNPDLGIKSVAQEEVEELRKLVESNAASIPGTVRFVSSVRFNYADSSTWPSSRTRASRVHRCRFHANS